MSADPNLSLTSARPPAGPLRLLARAARELGLVIGGGLVLAQLLVALLYMVLSDHLAQAQSQRLLLEQQAGQRHLCAVMPQRREREQCLLAQQSK